MSKAGRGLFLSCDMSSHRSLTLQRWSWCWPCLQAVSSAIHHLLYAININEAVVWFYVWEIVGMYSEIRKNWHILMSTCAACITAASISQSSVRCVVDYRPASLGGRWNKLVQEKGNTSGFVSIVFYAFVHLYNCLYHLVVFYCFFFV